MWIIWKPSSWMDGSNPTWRLVLLRSLSLGDFVSPHSVHYTRTLKNLSFSLYTVSHHTPCNLQASIPICTFIFTRYIRTKMASSKQVELKRKMSSFNKLKPDDFAKLVEEELGEPGVAKIMESNEITPDIVPLLTKQDLKECEFSSLGQRLRVLQCIRLLQQKSRSRKRDEIVWESDRFEECCAPSSDKRWTFPMFMQCCGSQKTHYTLTASSIKIDFTEDKVCLGFFCQCLGEERTTQHIDLSFVKDVSLRHKASAGICCCCCCTPGMDHIDVTHINDKARGCHMQLEGGQGDLVAKKILDCREEAQLDEATGMER